MPDKDPDGPSLELPSFGLGRLRKKKDADPQTVPAAARDAETVTVPVRAEPTPETAHEPVQARSDALLLGLGPLPASLLTGAAVGLLTALLAYASQRLCEVVRSTSSCGGAGVLLLLAILVGMTLLGGALLRAFVVPEAGSTSVLAMGLLAVLVLLFLVDAAFSPAIFAVLPVVAAGCYAAAHLVTAASSSTD